MPVEIFDIIIRGRGIRRTARRFGRLLGTITGVTAGLGALGAAFTAVGLIRFARNAANLAAEFEVLGVRLETLTGSAEGAADVLARIDALTAATPFGINELAETSASLAVIFRDNTAAVEEFTGVAADLAAAFGRPVEQIGQNLVRAFSSGLASAEVFRDAGITEAILQQAGATDVAEVSATQLAEALRGLAAEGGIAFQASARQAETLAGALSNSQDAFDRFQRSVGVALSPVLFDILTEVVIPTFEDLQELVVENEDAIREFALDGIRLAVSALGLLIQAAVRTTQFIRGLSGAFNEFLLGRQRARIEFLREDLETLREEVERTGDTARRSNFTGLNVAQTEAEIRQLTNAFQLNEAALNDQAEAFRRGEEFADGLDSKLAALERRFDTVNPVIEDNAEATTEAAEATKTLEERLAELDRRQAAGDAATRAREEAQLRQELSNLTDELVDGEEARGNALVRARQEIDAQIGRAGALGALTGNQVEAQRAINILLQQRRGIEEEIRQEIEGQRDARADVGDLTIEAGQVLDQLSQVNEELAQELSGLLVEALTAGLSDEALAERIRAIIERGVDAIEAVESFGDRVGDAVSDGLREGLRAALLGDGFDFAEFFAQRLADITVEQLSGAFDQIGDAIGGIFEGIGGGQGGGLSGALGGAIAGIGALALSQLGGTESNITTGLAESAVTSTQAVRGVVAGPQQIATATVGDAISDAFLDTNEILSDIRSGINTLVGQGAAGGGGDPAEADLGATSGGLA